MILNSKIIGEGYPLVILHGFLGMGDNWKTLSIQFSNQGYQVHLVDQRNHGRSFHSDKFNYEIMAADLADYCKHHGLERIHLLGHSMGGKTAMCFAGYYPNLVSKLIVADISPRKYEPHHQAILKALSSLDFSVINTRQEAENVLRRYIDDRGMILFLLKNVYWKTQGELALRINLPVLMAHVEEVNKSIYEELIFTGETLFLRGELSSYIEAEDERVIKKHFPTAKIQTILGAGHWLHAENTADFHQYVVDFL